MCDVLLSPEEYVDLDVLDALQNITDPPVS